MVQIKIPRQAVVIAAILLLVLGGGYYYVSYVLSADDFGGETIDADSQQAQSFLPSGGSASFRITDTLEKENEYKIITSQDGKKYFATIQGPDSWEITYVAPTLCFKKSTFTYTYCVPENVAGMSVIRNLIDGRTGGGENLSSEEKIAAAATPIQSLMKHLMFIEASVSDMRMGAHMEDHFLQLISKGETISIGTITDISIESQDTRVPEDAINLVKLARELDAKIKDTGEITVADLGLESSPEGDVLIVELMQAYGLDSASYRM